eukprot:GHUV01044905.1.p1 GENE.GHUV01044905.1~~GHUV01044905.1.p1  ORF type:complete len:120 (-),score=7.40 GHUV01044905.1:8-367(-)
MWESTNINCSSPSTPEYTCGSHKLCPSLFLQLLWCLEVRILVEPPAELVAVQAQALTLPDALAMTPCLQAWTYPVYVARSSLSGIEDILARGQECRQRCSLNTTNPIFRKESPHLDAST